MVAPGFVDLHTHYDAQLFYDPRLSPSPLHGVTTVVAGNCGLTLAPVRPGDQSFLARLLAQVESIPEETIEAGSSSVGRRSGSSSRWSGASRSPPTSGSSWVIGRPARRHGRSGVERVPPTPTSSTRCAACSVDSISEGGLGFSTANPATQVDGDGRPTPPNFAERDELVGLAAVCGDYPGTSIEFIPDSFIRGFSDEDVDLMADMSAAANRPLNWNTPLINPRSPTSFGGSCGRARWPAPAAASVVPLFSPKTCSSSTTSCEGTCSGRCRAGAGCSISIRRRGSLRSGTRVRAGAREGRRRARAGLATVVRNWASYRVNEVAGGPAADLEGRNIGELARNGGPARSRRWSRWPEVPARRRASCGPLPRPRRGRWCWEARNELLADPRVVLQASDAGAHLDMMAGADFPTQCLAELVREHHVFNIEEMVRQLTSVPAGLYGLVDRGHVAMGARADLVVFDPETVGATALRTIHDLPAGAAAAGDPVDGHGPCAGRRRGRGGGGRVHRRLSGLGLALGSRQHDRDRPGLAGQGARMTQRVLARSGKGAGGVCLGIDVGGTFTDAVLTDGVRGRGGRSRRPPRGVSATACWPQQGWRRERRGGTLEELLPTVSRFGLGTTAVTNTLASRTGRRVGLLTTEGFAGHAALRQGDPGGRRGRVAGTPRRDRAAPLHRRHPGAGRTATERSSCPSTRGGHGPGAAAWSRRRASRPSPCRTCGPSLNPVHETGHGAGGRRLAHPDVPVIVGRGICTRPYGSTSAPPMPSSTPTSRARSGESSSSRVPLRTSACRVPLLLVHSGGGLDHPR